jgi:hypothetical protein
MVMKTLSKILVAIICFQLSFGTYRSAAQAQSWVGAGLGTQLGGILTEDRDSVKVPGEENIHNAVDANKYVSEVSNQVALYEKYCFTKDDKEDLNAAFTYDKSIMGSPTMDIKNCREEKEKIIIYSQLAEELVSKYKLNQYNQNCSFCTTKEQQEGSDVRKFNHANANDIIQPGEKCSANTQKRLAKEPCNTYCLFKPALMTALSASTFGIGGSVAGLLLKGNDGCKATGPLKDQAKCAANLAKGLIKGIWAAFTGLAGLAKAAIVGAGHLIVKGAKAVGQGIANLWHSLWDTEDASSKSAHAVAQVPKKSQEDFNKDKEGWFASTIKGLMTALKEVVYIGMYNRDSKCMDCAAKGQLMCEIGGRIAADVVGFTFTMGTGAGALAAIAEKLGPKIGEIAEITGKIFAKSEKAVEAEDIAAKAGEEAVKPNVWRRMGNVAVDTRNAVSDGVREKWSALKNSPRFQKMMTPSEWKVTKVAKDVIPDRVVVAADYIKKPFKAYMDWDSRVFGKGAYLGARWAGKETALKALATFGHVGELNEAFEKNKDVFWKKVFTVPKDRIPSEEAVAELRRAGKLAEQGDNYVIRVNQKDFHDLMNGTKFESPTDPLTKLQTDFAGRVSVKTPDGKFVIKNVKELKPGEAEEIVKSGGEIVPADYASAKTPLTPEKVELNKNGIKVGSDGKIRIATEKGWGQVVDASKLTKEQIAELAKKRDAGEIFLGTKDDPDFYASIRKTKDANGKTVFVKDGDEVTKTEAAKTAALQEQAKTDPALADQLVAKSTQDVSTLKVIREILDMDGPMKESRAKLVAAVGKVKATHLEGLEEAEKVGYIRNAKTDAIEFTGDDGKLRSIPSKDLRDGWKVETYAGGSKAVLRSPEGHISLYDFDAKGANRVATIPPQYEDLFEKSVGKLQNHQEIERSAFNRLESDLKQRNELAKINGEAEIKYKVTPPATGADGKLEQQIQIELPQGCTNQKGGSVISFMARDAV